VRLRHKSKGNKSPSGKQVLFWMCGLGGLEWADVLVSFRPIPIKRGIFLMIHTSSASNCTEPIDLHHVRELYDGMATVIRVDGRISEFIEHVLRDLSGGDVGNVRIAVRNAHDRLGLTQ
jgi:UDP-3-O-acyl-N-acetylglucosamine deacetylase